MITLAQLVMFASACLASATVLVVHLSRPALGRAVRWMTPGAQTVSLELLIAAPWLVPLLVLALALAPSALALLWPGLDHCDAHGAHHAHICLMHPPGPEVAHLWFFTALAASVAVFGLARGVLREARAHAAARALCSLAVSADAGVWMVPTERVLCAVAGLVAPRILVSAGAVARVDVATLEIALAHERGHVERRDVARQSLARILASIHVPATRTWLLESLSVARELACDEIAAGSHDRVDVAEALVRWARVMAPASTPALLGFGPEVLELRVRSLLDEPVAPLRAPFVGIAALAAVTLAIGSIPIVHHALETVLGAFTH